MRMGEARLPEVAGIRGLPGGPGYATLVRRRGATHHRPTVTITFEPKMLIALAFKPLFLDVPVELRT